MMKRSSVDMNYLLSTARVYHLTQAHIQHPTPNRHTRESQPLSSPTKNLRKTFLKLPVVELSPKIRQDEQHSLGCGRHNLSLLPF